MLITENGIYSAADSWIGVTKKDGKIEDHEIEKIFDKLEPANMEVFKGDWKGHTVDTGHPGVKKNKEVRWAGKSFRSPDDVDPMVIYNDEVGRVWMEKTGRARLREVKYHGVVSTAMIYNNFPIIDHFRRVNDDMVAGVMDTPLIQGSGNLYFYLTKL